VGSHRGVPDISMSAACTGAVNVYQSFGGQPAGWYALCGTSEATPLFAGSWRSPPRWRGTPLGLIKPALYKMASGHSRASSACDRGTPRCRSARAAVRTPCAASAPGPDTTWRPAWAQ